MGAWGEGPLENDRALDWLDAEVTKPLEPRITDLLARFEADASDGAADELAEEVRAAAVVVLLLNYWRSDLRARLAQALRRIRATESWVERWNDQDEIRASLDAQVKALERGPQSTRLMEVLTGASTPPCAPANSDEVHEAVRPDSGLSDGFLNLVAARLRERGVDASVEFPGVLWFTAQGREWATGYTGLHVHSQDEHADVFPGDQHLRVLEETGGVTVGQYVDTLLAVIERRVQP